MLNVFPGPFQPSENAIYQTLRFGTREMDLDANRHGFFAALCPGPLARGARLSGALHSRDIPWTSHGPTDGSGGLHPGSAWRWSVRDSQSEGRAIGSSCR